MYLPIFKIFSFAISQISYSDLFDFSRLIHLLRKHFCIEITDVNSATENSQAVKLL